MLYPNYIQYTNVDVIDLSQGFRILAKGRGRGHLKTRARFKTSSYFLPNGLQFYNTFFKFVIKDSSILHLSPPIHHSRNETLVNISAPLPPPPQEKNLATGLRYYVSHNRENLMHIN